MTKYQNLIFKFVVLISASQLVFLTGLPLALAYADDLVIQNDGAVVLILTDNNVLAASTNAPEKKPAKVSPLVPSTTPSTVRIDPKPTKNQRINVTITPKASPGPGSAGVSQPTNLGGGKTTQSAPGGLPATGAIGGVQPTSQPSIAGVSPPGTINKQVTQIIAEGANGPIFSIKPQGSSQVMIQQGSSSATTSLPLQIDTQTKALSAVINNNPKKILVLPIEAVINVTAKGLLNQSTPAVPQQVNLVQNKGEIEYQIKGEKLGNLLGLFPIKTQVEVDLSAQAGTIRRVSQSPLFTFFGFLIK